MSLVIVLIDEPSRKLKLTPRKVVVVNLFFELLSGNEIYVDELRVWAQSGALGMNGSIHAYMHIESRVRERAWTN